MRILFAVLVFVLHAWSTRPPRYTPDDTFDPTDEAAGGFSTQGDARAEPKAGGAQGFAIANAKSRVEASQQVAR